MALTQWARSEPAPPVSGNHATVRAQSPDTRPPLKNLQKPARRPAPIPIVPDLAADCERVAAPLAKQLGDRCQVIVHEPFVIAGDKSRDELDAWYKQTIGP